MDILSLSQLLKKFVEWVKRFLRSSQTNAPKPFISVKEKQYPLGLLKLVEGRDTQHAVRTWIVCPTAVEPLSTPMDLHIYLDFTDARNQGKAQDQLAGQAQSATTLWATHTVTLMRVSHALRKNGDYTYHHIFSRQYDFKGQHTTAADVQARIVCDRIAVLAGMCLVRDLEWADEVEEIYRQVMGREGIASTQAFKFWRNKKQSSHLSPRSSRSHFLAHKRTKVTVSRYCLNNTRMPKTTRIPRSPQ